MAPGKVGVSMKPLYQQMPVLRNTGVDFLICERRVGKSCAPCQCSMPLPEEEKMVAGWGEEPGRKEAAPSHQAQTGVRGSAEWRGSQFLAQPVCPATYTQISLGNSHPVSEPVPHVLLPGLGGRPHSSGQWPASRTEKRENGCHQGPSTTRGSWRGSPALATYPALIPRRMSAPEPQGGRGMVGQGKGPQSSRGACRSLADRRLGGSGQRKGGQWRGKI